ncbi:unnamed protein product [Urochloa humidicola]
MFPFCDSSSPMDLPLYQQLQLSPPSPKPDQSTTSFLYYPCSPPFAAADAACFHLSYQQLGSATPPPQAVIDDSPEPPPPPPLMEPAPAQQAAELDAASAANAHGGAASLDRAAAAAAARKDRHSKICTAGGMRDRRMRLSLDVARKFFALQDMLGFDKASKTVQWLLNTSKAAIHEIMADDASSECAEDGSSSLSVAAAAAELGDHHQRPNKQPEGTKKPLAKARKAAAAAAGPKPPRKPANAHPVPDKETRAKARERARERTKEKHRMRWVKLASAIDVEAAAARDRPPGSNNNLSHQLEGRCPSSSALNNGGRMQEITGAGDVILGFGGSGGGYVAGGGSYYCQQEQQWDLGGVVFQQNPRFY